MIYIKYVIVRYFLKKYFNIIEKVFIIFMIVDIYNDLFLIDLFFVEK